MAEIKMTGNISKDINSIYDMVNYIAACTDKLVEEWENQNLGISLESLNILEVQKHLNKAKEYMYRIRNWQEPERKAKV